MGVAAVATALVALGVPSAAAPQFGNLEVDTTADGNDGECANDCTLREAVALADVNQGQWVSLPPGVYRLTLGPIVLARNSIVFGVSFSGSFSSGARSTVIDARGTSGAFEVPSGSSATLAGLTVTGGNAPNGGGAFVADGGQLSVYSTIFRGNVAAGRGGAIASAGSLASFNSTFSGNRAAAGGAIAVEPDSSSAALISSTFSGNSATGSGGAITAAGSVQAQRVTIANNSAPAGGGFFQESVTGANTAMWSVLLGGNPGGDCGGSIAGIPRSIASANLDSDGTCAWAAGQGTTADARLGSLANNGGPTDTVAIGSGSPAIDAADQQLCGPGGPDQRSAPAVGPCDIGAFEFGGVPPEPVLPPPEAGKTVNVNKSRGTVRVKLPGSNEFFDLEDAQQVPVGSTFDTAKGRINLVAAGNAKAWFYEGIFKFGQPKGNKPLSTLTLTGKLSCGGGNKAGTAAAKNKKRRLWGDGKGRFQTKGKHSAATVVGTRWLVEDRCNGTLTKVTRGKVRVRDFRAKRTVTVRAGKQYFARAK